MDVFGFENVITTFIFGVVIILFFCWYSARNYQYWKERNIPFVKPLPIFGSLLETFGQSLHSIEVERYKKYGKVYGHFEGSNPSISIGDPALLRNILVKDFHAFPDRRVITTGEPTIDLNIARLSGDDWKRIRSIITPTFTTGKIKKMISIFRECSQVCVNHFTQYAKSGKPIDIKTFFESFTMDVIASSAFSTKIDSQKDPNNQFVSSARDLFKNFFGWRFMMLLTVPKLVKFLGMSALPLKETRFFRDITLKIIEERERTGKVRNDFLQLLLDTAKETEEKETQEPDDLTANYGKEEANEQVLRTFGKKKLSNMEVVAQCVLFFFAGFDAASTTLSLIFYELAINPDVQERLIAELDESLASSDGKVTYEAIQNMKTLDNVISETLRIYPPAIRIERTTYEDYDLGYKGIKLTKGMMVTVPVFALHNDPNIYPEPEKFNPDRFLPEERAKRDQLTYLPFGFGPRNCIGMRFVLVQIKVCMAFLLSNFRFKRCNETKVPLQFLPGNFLLRPKEIMLQLELRTDSIKAK